MVLIRCLLIALFLPALLGCAQKYGCKGYPDKAACLSASEAYRATEGAMPASRDNPPSDRPESRPTEPVSATLGARRSEARLLRIWNAPYENADGDLEGAHYTLADIEPRRWEVEGIPLRPLQRPRPPAQTDPGTLLRSQALSRVPTRAAVEDEEDEFEH